MPRLPINYQNTIIYKICCKDPDVTDIYVGLTTDLRNRRNTHKCHCNNVKCSQYNSYMYRFIRDNGGWDNWQIVVVENFPCQNKTEGEQRERYWLEYLHATLNKNVPTRTIEEYRTTDTYKEYIKQYKIKNRERIKEKDKQSLARRNELKKQSMLNL